MEQPEQPPLAGTLSIPVACDPRVFTRAERAEHLALCVDVLVRWPKRRIELDDGYLFEFEGDEERFLVRNLPGYPEYQGRVRYRLIPFIW